MIEDIDFSEPPRVPLPSPDVAVADLLAAAAAAGVGLSCVRGRLAYDLRGVRWDRWPKVKSALDAIGEEAVCAYLTARS
jgi:hypothetical protein